MKRSSPVSAAFVSSLAGVVMTLLSWYGPWEWPAAPAFAALWLLFRNRTSWLELEYGARGAVLALLIVVNVGFWAVVFLATARAVARFRRRTR